MFDCKSFIHTSRIVLSTLRSIVIIGGFSHTCQQFTSLTGNQVGSTMFDFNTFNRMDRIVLVLEEEIKTLYLVSTIEAARSFIIHYVVDYSRQMVASMLCLQY